MAERSGRSVAEMVYWYNFTPKASGVDPAPCNLIKNYEWRCPLSEKKDEDSETVKHDFEVGKEVFVRPQNARCTTVWRRGVVTGVPSAQSVEVDGLPVHIADVRKIPGEVGTRRTENLAHGLWEVTQAEEVNVFEEPENEDVSEGSENEEVVPSPRRGRRERQRPLYLNDFFC